MSRLFDDVANVFAKYRSEALRYVKPDVEICEKGGGFRDQRRMQPSAENVVWASPTNSEMPFECWWQCPHYKSGGLFYDHGLNGRSRQQHEGRYSANSATKAKRRPKPSPAEAPRH